MRFSKSATAAFLVVFFSSSPSALATSEAEPKPDTVAESSQPTPTPTTTISSAAPPTSSSSANLLGALYQLASSYDLIACVPAALPLITALPPIPPNLISGGVVQQALSQTSRDLDGVCDFSITGDVGTVYTSFLPTWYSWYHANTARVESLISRCTGAAPLTKTVEAYETCSQVRSVLSAYSATAVAPTTPTDAGSTTSTATIGPSDTDTATTTDLPSAAGETSGLLGNAAGLAAGLLGFAAVL